MVKRLFRISFCMFLCGMICLSNSTAFAMANDKAKHIGVSASVGLTLVHLPPFKKWTPLERVLFNVIVVGGAKELYDRSHGGKAEWADIAADAIGASIGEGLGVVLKKKF